MGWRVLTVAGGLAVAAATLLLVYAGELPAPPWFRLWMTGFLVVLCVLLGLYSYFQSVEDRLRRFAISLLLTSGVLLATKVLAGWTVDIQLEGFFKFLLARGDPGVDLATLFVAIVFTSQACLLIWWGSKIQLNRDSRVSSSSQPELLSFCQRVAGHWWSIAADPDSIGFATIKPDNAASTLIVNGWAYTSNGHSWARWYTTASSIDLESKELRYIWKGEHLYQEEQHPQGSTEYYGFGVISFPDVTDRINTGFGKFYDINVTNVKSIREKRSTWRRCSCAKEVDIMTSFNRPEIGRLVQEKLNEYRK